MGNARQDAGRSATKLVALTLAGAVLSLVAAGNVAPLAADDGVPVMIGGEPDLDACASLGEVTGLDPKGENFLSVRTGPGVGFAAVDRLAAAAQVYICETRGNWLGIVYPGGDCGVSTPITQRRAYRGNCRSGWVCRKYVTPLAG